MKIKAQKPAPQSEWKEDYYLSSVLWHTRAEHPIEDSERRLVDAFINKLAERVKSLIDEEVKAAYSSHPKIQLRRI